MKLVHIKVIHEITNDLRINVWTDPSGPLTDRNWEKGFYKIASELRVTKEIEQFLIDQIGETINDKSPRT